METRIQSETGNRPHRGPRHFPAAAGGRMGIDGRRRSFAAPANDNIPPLRHLIARLGLAALVGIAASAAILFLIDRVG